LTADSKALPEYPFTVDERYGGTTRFLTYEQNNGDTGVATEEDLAAVLAAMDPEQRGRVIAEFFYVDWERVGRSKVTDERDELQEALVAERAKVAELRAKLAKVDAFFAEHGEQLDHATLAGLLRTTSENRADRAQWEAAYRAFQRLHHELRPPDDWGWFSDGVPKGTTGT
jgi:hypothetical protein